MKINVFFKNELGMIPFSETVHGKIKLTEILGLGLVDKEYRTVVFYGYNGQETVYERALPRTVTLGVEFCMENLRATVENFLRVIGKPGYLYIETEHFSRKIFCNQVKVSDENRILLGEITNIVVQFVCDSPFFEDSEEHNVPLYKRTKNLSTPFSLPCCFGTVVTSVVIDNQGSYDIEPVVRIFCGQTIADAERIVVKNITTDKKICIDYIPGENEEILIDIKNRRVSSNVLGNISDKLSDDTFLGDFVFVPGINRIETFIGNAASGFMAECRYTNLYSEAMLV